MTRQTDDPLPPEGCICASFWTVRHAHKSSCPLASSEPNVANTPPLKTSNSVELDKIVNDALDLIKPVVKVKSGTGLMHMDSARLLLKNDIRRYAQKMVLTELKRAWNSPRSEILNRVTAIEKELEQS